MNAAADAHVAAAIRSAIQTVLRDTGRPAAAVEPGMLLVADLGLDSLDLAQSIVLLERSLGVDPFRAAPASAAGASAPRPPLRTVSDLVSIYVSTLASHHSPSHHSPSHHSP